MTKRRHAEDEDDEPSGRGSAQNWSRPKNRKRPEQKKAKRPILLLILLGIVGVAFLAVWAVVLLKPRQPRDGNNAPEAGGASVKPGGGVSAVAGTNLLTNGSFEDGPEPDAGGPGFTPFLVGATEIRGWNITRGSVDYIGPYWQHADGRRSIDLNGNEPGTLAQTFRTRPGKKYRVSFQLAGNGCGDGSGVKVVIVRAAGTKSEFSFDTEGRSYESMGWVSKTWEFTATAEETTLEFESATDLSPACGPALDQVSVVEVGA
jgi:choice-of-anchor C domain-containing protein